MHFPRLGSHSGKFSFTFCLLLQHFAYYKAPPRESETVNQENIQIEDDGNLVSYAHFKQKTSTSDVEKYIKLVGPSLAEKILVKL